jgi:hypothetical protein
LLVITVLVTLLLMECVLRIFGIPKKNARFVCFHPVMGKVYCASTEGTYTKAGCRRHLVVNTDGMVDREYSVNRSGGTLRVALLGNSFAASEYLSTEDKFEGLLERDLSPTVSRMPRCSGVTRLWNPGSCNGISSPMTATGTAMGTATWPGRVARCCSTHCPGSSPSRHQYQFADGLAGLQVAVGIRHPVEGVGGYFRSHEFSLFEPVEQLLQSPFQQFGAVKQVTQVEP